MKPMCETGCGNRVQVYGNKWCPDCHTEQMSRLYCNETPSAEVERYQITPVPKPRQTQSDRWKKRPAVMRYRAFKDEVRELGITVPDSGCQVVFVIPMPKSWAKKKRAQMCGQPHQQTPDKDNLEKALLDAVFGEDSHIYDLHPLKFWGEEGAIIIRKTARALRLEGNQVIWEENAA